MENILITGGSTPQFTAMKINSDRKIKICRINDVIPGEYRTAGIDEQRDEQWRRFETQRGYVTHSNNFLYILFP